MNRLAIAAATPVIVSIVAGCSGRESVRSTLYDPAHPLPPRSAEAPVTLIAAPAPECPYDPIGTVTVVGRRPLPSQETTSAMMREARRMGGDAIIALSAAGSSLAGTVVRFRDTTCTR